MRKSINHLLGAALSLLVTLASALATVAHAASVIPLGDLPGGIFESVAYDVSADGKTVVGESYNANGIEAFRWTASDPIHMVGLGQLVGSGGSRARAVSADGSIVVGSSGGEAFRWTAPGGIVGLGDLPGGNPP